MEQPVFQPEYLECAGKSGERAAQRHGVENLPLDVDAGIAGSLWIVPNRAHGEAEARVAHHQGKHERCDHPDDCAQMGVGRGENERKMEA